MPKIVEQPHVPKGSLAIIERAVELGMSADQLAKLVDLHRTLEADRAEAAYAQAMNAAQSEMPRVIRSKKNTQTDSLYAPLEAVNEQVMPVFTRHGFSLSFSEGKADKEGDMRVTCICQHAAGHHKVHYLDGALDLTGMKGAPNKTAIQAKGSTATYLRRYLVCMIGNVTIANEDQDGQSQQQLVDEAQICLMKDWIDLTGSDVNAILAYAEPELEEKDRKLEVMRHSMYLAVMSYLKRRHAHQQKEGAK